MKTSFSKQLLIPATLLAVIIVPVVYFTATAKDTEYVELGVPYVPQVFDGNWTAPWDEACEEASATMIEAFYQDRTSVPPEEAKSLLLNMVEWEKTTFGNYQDTTALETVRLIEEHTQFGASIARTPSIEDIKNQLVDGRPVIAFVNMYELYGERNLGDAFHVFVITGFDEKTHEFIVNDPAREKKRYSYDVLMKSLHDFVPETKEPTGEPTVLFTTPPTFGGQSFFDWVWSIFGRRAAAR